MQDDAIDPIHRAAKLEKWLREEVAPVYDAMRIDPSRGLSVQAVFDQIRSRHAARLEKQAR